MDKREGWKGKQSKWCTDSKRSLFSDDICLSSLNTFGEQTTKRLASLLPEGKLGSSHYNSLNTRQHNSPKEMQVTKMIIELLTLNL